MKWSDRKLEEFERYSKFSILKKFIVIGKCREIVRETRTLATEEESICTKRSSFGKKVQSKSFIMLYNLQTHSLHSIKILNIHDAQITAVNYGPFDNGYLVIGLSTGLVIIIDIHTMDVIMEVQLFKCAVKTITFEPTHLIFVASK